MPRPPDQPPQIAAGALLPPGARRVSLLRVRFTEPREFVAELAADSELVERKIVRLTKMARPTGPSGVLTAVYVIGSALVDGRLIRFEAFCGELWGHSRDDAVQRRATELMDDLERRLLAIGLEPRAGVLEENDER